jgi:bud site selection protein 31
MPVIRSARNRKPPPDGFDDIEDTLLEFANKMKDAENASHDGKKKHETLWPIFQITHQRESIPSPSVQHAVWAGSPPTEEWITVAVAVGFSHFEDGG